MSEVLRTDISDRVATLMLCRPAARNALNDELRSALQKRMRALDEDDAVDVVILTGSDPAFCAGLDLKELGQGRHDLRAGFGGDGLAGDVHHGPVGPFPLMQKPVIGAVNGAAITGGLELALQCDFLVASERACFADTHARVGVMPGWGLTVLLPQAVGVRKAREMSVTGNFMTAGQAIAFGLVNHVVPHDELLEFAQRLATDIVGNDQAGVRRMLATYQAVTATAVAEGLRIEAQVARGWQGRTFDAAEVERRRATIVDRGRSQVVNSRVHGRT